MLENDVEFFIDTIKPLSEVWTLTENLVSPKGDIRHAALEEICDSGFHRISPLIAYTLGTRLNDPDINFRLRIVQMTSELLVLGDSRNHHSGNVRKHLKEYISQMRRRTIFALLQVVDKFPDAESDVAVLLNNCSHAGKNLADIIVDRKAPLRIRHHAINFVTLVGFLDVIPTLARIAARLEQRTDGKYPANKVSESSNREISLLPVIQAALKSFEDQ